MRKILLFILLCGSLTAVADERGKARLERISRHYSAMGNYVVSFVLRTGGTEQRGEMLVSGNNSYMRVADMEVFVEDSIRYEVRSTAKEVVIDKAEYYERELLNPLSGFSWVYSDYNVEECEVDGNAAVRLTPKQSGEVVCIVTKPDGESIAKVQYGAGEGAVELDITHSRKSADRVKRFRRESYSGYEIIDFR